MWSDFEMEAAIPRIKKAVLTQKLNIAIDDQTKRSYEMLKESHGIDVAECVRRAVRAELARLRDAVGAEPA